MARQEHRAATAPDKRRASKSTSHLPAFFVSAKRTCRASAKLQEAISRLISRAPIHEGGYSSASQLSAARPYTSGKTRPRDTKQYVRPSAPSIKQHDHGYAASALCTMPDPYVSPTLLSRSAIVCSPITSVARNQIAHSCPGQVCAAGQIVGQQSAIGLRGRNRIVFDMPGLRSHRPEYRTSRNRPE